MSKMLYHIKILVKLNIFIEKAGKRCSLYVSQAKNYEKTGRDGTMELLGYQIRVEQPKIH